MECLDKYKAQRASKIRFKSSVVWAFLKNNEGQAVLEYILLLSLISVFVVTLLKTLFSTVRKGMLRINAQVEADLTTGEGYRSATFWKN